MTFTLSFFYPEKVNTVHISLALFNFELYNIINKNNATQYSCVN